jgi:hypothetical protein
VEEKECASCGQSKPLSEYRAAKKGKFGVRGSCKQCEGKKAKERYWANPEKYRNYSRDYRKNNSEKCLNDLKKWRKQNKDHVTAYKKKIYEENADKLRLQSREYYQKNREQELLKCKNWRTKNKAWWKEYYQKNRERFKQHNRNRKARIRGAEGSHTATEIKVLYKLQKGLCNTCGTPLNNNYHADHIIPVSRGGTNWINNIQLLCPPCNYKKGNKTMEEFLPVIESVVN